VRVIQRRAVTWRIPPPNSSSSFEMSAMTFVATLDICGVDFRNFISSLSLGMIQIQLLQLEVVVVASALDDM